MIGSLRGRLLDRGTSDVLVEVAGVGYRVTIAPTTAVGLGELGDEVFVWVHHHIREDAETLYGFASRDERVTFEALIGAHGVGPALALAILSVHAPVALTRILLEDDVAALCLVPGVGKKTAARLLVELKSRLDIPDADLASSVAAGRNGNGSGLPGGAGGLGPASARSDVRAALAGLGYTGDEIREATLDLPDDGDAAELLRAALSRLATGR
jgi:Holliday junction DNA helicase RuvA